MTCALARSSFSYDQSFSLNSDLWMPGAPTPDKSCAVSALYNGQGRYLDSANCEADLPFVCETPPLYVRPGEPGDLACQPDCPLGYFAYKSECFRLENEARSYEDAQVC